LNKLQKAEDIISKAVHVPSELILSFFTWGGILCENGNPGQSENSYAIALIMLFRLYGDPRGRHNRGVPYEMLVSWKLAQIARAESRTHDAFLADEIFDAAFMSTKQYLSLRHPGKGKGSPMNDHVWFPHWSLTG